jgi:copper chaperone CopZ
MIAVQETIFMVQEFINEHRVNTINGALKGLPGIESVNTDITTHTVRLRYNPDQISIAKIELALEDIGYTILVRIDIDQS